MQTLHPHTDSTAASPNLSDHPELLVYKASAGAGKTFTLAVEYIKLLIRDPRAYRSTLAVTFTNKATTEMKERILSQLYGIWIADPKSDVYLKRIADDLKQPAADIRVAAGKALHYMIHDYSRFRVETIDSFFQSVMRNLARELELGANLNIELNNLEVLSDAVDSLIEKLDRNSPVLYWLLEYIEERIADDKRWNVANEIKSFGRNIFDEGYIEKGDGLRKKLQQKDCITHYRRTLKDIETEIIEQMKGFADQFFGILETHGLQASDLKNGQRGIASYFNKLKNSNFSSDIRNATVEKCLNNPEEWATKSSAQRELIVSLASSELIPLLDTAETFRAKNELLSNTCNLSLRHVNNLRLLAHIDEEVRQLNYEHNRFLLSDTNALLHRLIKEGDPSFVFEKIGTTIRNVMIDEFQDTSRMQWDNFRLLLLEGLSQGADSLIVGDVKQSIYRWRSGDWGILNGLRDHIDSFPIEVKTLTTNRRSAAQIILFNNDLFTAACQVLNDRYREEQGEDCLALQEAYQDVCQETCNDPGKGYVRVEFLGDGKDNETGSYADQMLEKLAAETRLLVEQGVALKDIAILVRKNKTIPLIADYFDKNTPYRIVSDEAFRLDASLAVTLLIDGLRTLMEPDDRIAQAQLAAAYQQEVLHRDIDLNTLLLDGTEAYLPPAFCAEREQLRLMPLYELLEKLFGMFEVSRLEQQDAYLCAFFDAVSEYLESNSSELSAFLTYWEERLGSKTIPSGEVEGIRILSIHKSKGLEYHTVLLPFCDWKMENETNDHLVWCAPQQNPFNQLDIVPVNYGKAMQQSLYRNDFLHERLQLWVDNLNLLYVAFTRAKSNLIIWGKQVGKTTSKADEPLRMNTVSELLAESLSALTGQDFAGGQEVYEKGALCLSKPASSAPSDPKSPEKPASLPSTPGNKLLVQPTAIPVHLESLETPIEFKQSNRSADFIRGDEEEDAQKYIRQGQLLHQLFSVIRTADDVDGAIEQLRFEGLIESSEQAEQLRKLIQRALQHPRAQRWYAPGMELYNERSIICSTDGTLQTYRPDRVMIRDNEVIVVDFKFGKKKAAYVQQVKKYMQLLTDMGYPAVKGYLWYVFSNELEEVDAGGELFETDGPCG